MNEWIEYMNEVMDIFGPFTSDSCMAVPDYDW
jgi:hypothetical protein